MTVLDARGVADAGRRDAAHSAGLAHGAAHAGRAAGRHPPVGPAGRVRPGGGPGERARDAGGADGADPAAGACAALRAEQPAARAGPKSGGARPRRGAGGRRRAASARSRRPSAGPSAARSSAASSACSAPSRRARRPPVARGGSGLAGRRLALRESALTLPPPDAFTAEALLDAYPILSAEERLEGFAHAGRQRGGRLLPRAQHPRPGRICCRSSAPSGAGPGCACSRPTTRPTSSRRLPRSERERLLALLDDADAQRGDARCSPTPRTTAGGLMNPRYARLRPDMTVDEAITLPAPAGARAARDHLLRLRARRTSSSCSAWSRSASCSPRRPSERVRDIMHTDVVTVRRGHGPGGASAASSPSTTCSRSRSSTPRAA